MYIVITHTHTHTHSPGLSSPVSVVTKATRELARTNRLLESLLVLDPVLPRTVSFLLTHCCSESGMSFRANLMFSSKEDMWSK